MICASHIEPLGQFGIQSYANRHITCSNTYEMDLSLAEIRSFSFCFAATLPDSFQVCGTSYESECGKMLCTTDNIFAGILAFNIARVSDGILSSNMFMAFAFLPHSVRLSGQLSVNE